MKKAPSFSMSLVFLSTFFVLIGVYCTDPTKPDFLADKAEISLLLPGTLDTINNVIIGITVYDTITIGIERYIPEFIDSIRLDIADDTTFLFKNTPDTTISADYDTIRISFVFTEPGEKIISACAFISGADSNCTVSLKMLIAGKSATVLIHPDSLITVTEGDTAMLAVYATGSDTIRYKWYKYDSLLTLYTEDTLLIPACQISDSGKYTCIAYNSWGAPDTSDSSLLRVLPKNKKPVFISGIDSCVMNEKEVKAFVIKAVDPDNDSIWFDFLNYDTLLQIFDSTELSWGYARDSMNILFSPGYKPGVYRFSISVTDSSETDVADIIVTVTDINFAPVLDSIRDTTVKEGVQVTFTARASDVDGDSLTLAAESLPAGAAFTDNGNNTATFTWQPTFNDSGTYSVKVLASDGVLADSQFVTIRVLDSKFIITATASAGGTISPAGTVSVEYGANQKFDITPDTGYHIADVQVDGLSIGVVPSYNFTLVANNHTIHADFAINTYTLTLSGDANGTTIPSGDSLVTHGAATRIIAVPSSGFHLLKWACSSGTALIADTLADTTTVTLNSGNAAVTAHFEINTYTMTALTQGNGTVTVSPVKPLYTHGDTVTLTAAPATGSHFTGWSGDATGTANPLTVIVTSNVNITANFAINQYSVTFVAGTNGNITGTLVQAVAHGSDCSPVTAIPDSLYHFTGWTGNYTGTDNPLTVTNVTADMTITAEFAIDSNTVTFIAGTNGTITGTLVQTIAYGSDCSPVTPVADATYHFTNWTGDYAGTDNPLTVTNVTADMTITANFAIDTHTVTFVAGTNGSITGTLVQEIAHGSDCSPITPVPDNDFRFTEWTGSYQGTDNPLTIQNVTSAMSITANFLLQADFYVDANSGDDILNDGTWQKPFLTITRTVNVAQSGDVIHVLPGTYDAALGETFPVQLKSNQRLLGDISNKGCGQDSTIIIGNLQLRSGRIAGFAIKGPDDSGSSSIVIGESPIKADNNTLLGGWRGVYIHSWGPSPDDTIEFNDFVQTKNGIFSEYRSPFITGNTFSNPFDSSYAITFHYNGGILRSNIFRCINGILLDKQAHLNLGTATDPGNNDFSLVSNLSLYIHETPSPADPINAIGNIWPNSPPDCWSDIRLGTNVTGSVVYGTGASDTCP